MQPVLQQLCQGDIGLRAALTRRDHLFIDGRSLRVAVFAPQGIGQAHTTQGAHDAAVRRAVANPRALQLSAALAYAAQAEDILRMLG